MRMSIAFALVLALASACTDQNSPVQPTASCQEFTCSADSQCLQGFVCSHGACAMQITCNEVPEECPVGEYPYSPCLWTGCACYADDRQPPPPPPPPACSTLTTEADCTARTDCKPVYEGIDCTTPSGGACKPGDPSCTCASFQFASCQAR